MPSGYEKSDHYAGAAPSARAILITILVVALIAAVVGWLLAGRPALAGETVCVKYGPCPLDLATFECTDTPQSSFVRRVCYDEPKQFMVIKLQETWYPYCAIDAVTVDELLGAESVGTYYNQNLRGGPFDCRVHPMPSY